MLISCHGLTIGVGDPVGEILPLEAPFERCLSSILSNIRVYFKNRILCCSKKISCHGLE